MPSVSRIGEQICCDTLCWLLMYDTFVRHIDWFTDKRLDNSVPQRHPFFPHPSLPRPLKGQFFLESKAFVGDEEGHDEGLLASIKKCMSTLKKEVSVCHVVAIHEPI